MADVGPLLVRLEQSDRLDTAKLGAAVQHGDLEDEEVPDQVTPELLDESASSSSGTAYEKKKNTTSAGLHKHR